MLASDHAARPSGALAHGNSYERSLFYILVAVFVWAPLPIGSNSPWAWSMLEALMAGLALLWVYGYWRGWLGFSEAWRRAWIARWLLLVWLLYGLMQMIPMPLSWLVVLSPAAHEAHAALSLISGTNVETGTLSLALEQTWISWLKSINYVLVFVLTLLLVRGRRRLQILLWAVVISGTFQATFGAVMTLSGLEWLLFQPKEHYLGAATGTFVNRNHFGGYLAMSLSLGMGLLIMDRGRDWSGGLKRKIKALLALLLSNKAILRLMLIIMMVGLVLSHSRMANIAFFSALGMAAVMAVATRKIGFWPVVVLFSSVLLVDVLIVGAWFGMEQVAARIEQTSFVGESRDEVYRYAILVAEDFWRFGYGLGAFADVFPAYRGEDISLFFRQAHNDYLELFLEAGMPGALILIGMFLLHTVLAFRLLIFSYSRTAWATALGASMAILAISIHSLVDFNLRIPANAMLFSAALALLWVARSIDALNQGKEASGL